MLNRAMQYTMMGLAVGPLSPSAGSGAEPQSQTIFGYLLIECSSFSSIVYHIKKLAQDFEKLTML